MAHNKAINGGTVYSPDDTGWVLKCMADVRNNHACAIIMDSSTVLSVMKTIKDKAEAISKHTVPLPGQDSLPIDPAAIVGALAAAGSVGGIVGVTSVMIGMAHARGMTVSASFVFPPDIMDPTKAEFHVEFSPKVPA
jgi:hypothetical protein